MATRSNKSTCLSSEKHHLCLRSHQPVAAIALQLPPNRAELTQQLAMAAIGAGVITTLAVAQGQSPLTALSITMFSAIAAVAVGQVI